MEPDQPRLGASVMTHNYRRGRPYQPVILQPAEPTKPLVIASLRRGSRCSGLSGSSPEKKSGEAPEGPYRLREFLKKIRPWASVA